MCLKCAANGRRKNCADCLLARPVPLKVKARIACRKMAGRDLPAAPRKEVAR